jgi:hypothetical protein
MFVQSRHHYGIDRPLTDVLGIRFLASLGNQPCVATISGVSFCRRGDTQITGLAVRGVSQTVASWYAFPPFFDSFHVSPSLSPACLKADCCPPSMNVARGAGIIMDLCTRPALDGSRDLTVKGANEAFGNGNLLVDIRRNVL